MTKIELSDSEWMSLIDGSDERHGLLICCANVSALRDRILTIARHGGYVHDMDLDMLKEVTGWVEDSHDLEDLPAFVKLRNQLGMEHQPHNPSRHGEVF